MERDKGEVRGIRIVEELPYSIPHKYGEQGRAGKITLGPGLLTSLNYF